MGPTPTRRGFYGLAGGLRGSRDSSGATVFEAVEDSVQQYMRDFADWIYAQLEAEWEYQNSDDHVDESIRINGYEFDEFGNIA